MPMTIGSIITGVSTTYYENGYITIDAPEVIFIKTNDRELADKMLKIVEAHVKRINKDNNK